MQNLLQEEKKTSIASPRTLMVRNEENQVENSISLAYKQKEEAEVVKKQSGPEEKTVTEIVSSGVVIEQGEGKIGRAHV